MWVCFRLSWPHDVRRCLRHSQNFRPNRRGYDARAKGWSLAITWLAFNARASECTAERSSEGTRAKRARRARKGVRRIGFRQNRVCAASAYQSECPGCMNRPTRMPEEPDFIAKRPVPRLVRSVQDGGLRRHCDCWSAASWRARLRRRRDLLSGDSCLPPAWPAGGSSFRAGGRSVLGQRQRIRG